MPKPHIVALSGFGSSPISIRLHDELFDDSDQVIVPPWKKLEALTSAKEVLALKSTGGSSMDFRNILAVPPLLAHSITSSISLAPEDLLIDCLSAINAFDTTHKDDSDFPLASTSCRRAIQFLWAAANNHLNIVVSIPHDAGHTKKFKDDLQDKFILASSFISPNP